MTDEDAQAFAEFVSEQAVGREAVIQSVRFYLAERLDHPDSDDLEAELTRDVPDAERWLQQLADGGGLLEDSALAVLAAAWQAPEQRDAIQRAVKTATAKLPVVDPAVLATFVLYGLNLLLKNTSRKEKTVARGRNGKTTTTSLEETGALAVILGAIQRGRASRR